jgi:hypothetical protein
MQAVTDQRARVCARLNCIVRLLKEVPNKETLLLLDRIFGFMLSNLISVGDGARKGMIVVTG